MYVSLILFNVGNVFKISCKYSEFIVFDNGMYDGCFSHNLRLNKDDLQQIEKKIKLQISMSFLSDSLSKLLVMVFTICDVKCLDDDRFWELRILGLTSNAVLVLIGNWKYLMIMYRTSKYIQIFDDQLTYFIDSEWMRFGPIIDMMMIYEINQWMK